MIHFESQMYSSTVLYIWYDTETIIYIFNETNRCGKKTLIQLKHKQKKILKL